jgi:hypothetical protein
MLRLSMGTLKRMALRRREFGGDAADLIDMQTRLMWECMSKADQQTIPLEELEDLMEPLEMKRAWQEVQDRFATPQTAERPLAGSPSPGSNSGEWPATISDSPPKSSTT